MLFTYQYHSFPLNSLLVSGFLLPSSSSMTMLVTADKTASLDSKMGQEKWEYIFTHSDEMPPQLVAQSRAFTTMPIRISKYNHFADAGSYAGTRDWAMLCGDDREKVYHALRSPTGNGMGLCIPESLPHELGFISYVAEECFLYDDGCEQMQINEARARHEVLASTFHNIYDQKESLNQKCQTILARAVLEWFESGEAPLAIFEAISNEWLHILEHDDLWSLKTFDELYLVCITSGMGIKLTPSEEAALADIHQICLRCAMYTNDYFAWKKESTIFVRNGQVFNVVWYFMTHENMTEDGALEKVKSLVLEEEARFSAAQIALLESDDATPNIRRSLDAIAAALGGNNYWSAVCPRYNDWESPVTLPPPNTVSISELVKFASLNQMDMGGGPLLEYDVGSLSLQINRDKVGQGSAGDEAQQQQTEDGPSATENTGIGVPIKQPTNGSKKIPTNVTKTRDPEFTLLDHSVLLAPIEYISSLPSKGVRKMLIEAINLWTKVPLTMVGTIIKVIDALHNASLILDDFQDQSPLRRGSPATHTVFGIGQASNSASYLYLQATTLVVELGDPQMTTVFLQELDKLIVGQSWDLYWSFHTKVPSRGEYLAMVDGKTGALFRMLLRLMTCAMVKYPTRPDLDVKAFEAMTVKLSRVIGHFFQIRDDYKNLTSAEYEATKGFAEDLDERKCSYPLVITIKTHPAIGDQILGLFRLPERHLSVEIKRHILKLLDKAGAFDETAKFLTQLEKEIEEKIGELEELAGIPNLILRALLKKLSV